MTHTDTTAKNATGIPEELDHSAGTVTSSDSAQTRSTAPTGTRLWLSLVQIRQPGIARPRGNRSCIRDPLAPHAMPQNSCPMQEMRITTSPAVEDSALSKIASEVPPPSL